MRSHILAVEKSRNLDGAIRHHRHARERNEPVTITWRAPLVTIESLELLTLHPIRQPTLRIGLIVLGRLWFGCFRSNSAAIHSPNV